MRSFFSGMKNISNATVLDTARWQQDPPMAGTQQPREAGGVSHNLPSPVQTPSPSPPLTGAVGQFSSAVPPRAFPVSRQAAGSQTPERVPIVQGGTEQKTVVPSMAKAAPIHPQKMKAPLIPGAKIIPGGAFPPGVMLMKSQLPPGAKFIKGPPPPGLMKKMVPPPGVSPKVQTILLPQKVPAKVVQGVKSPPVSPSHLPPRIASAHFSLPKVIANGTSLLIPPSPQQLQNQKRTLSPSFSPKRSGGDGGGNSDHQEREKSSISFVEYVNGESEQLQKPGRAVRRNSKVLVMPPTPKNVTNSDSDDDINFVIETESADDVPQERNDIEIMDKSDRILSNTSSLRFYPEESTRSMESAGANHDKTAAPQRSYDSRRNSRMPCQLSGSALKEALVEITQTDKKKVHTKEDKHTDAQQINMRSTSSLPSSSPRKRVEIPKKQEIERSTGKQVFSETKSSLTPLRLDSTSTRRREGSSSSSSVPLVFLGSQFEGETLTATPESKLPSGVRSRVAKQFLSILCPQQFYGRVTKIHRIRLVNSDPERVPGIKEHNTIFVATKGVLPSKFFYPQLRLNISDGTPVSSNESPGSLDTPIILYEAAPGNMLFVDTELEAKHAMETNTTTNSCFLLEESAIVFRDPQRYALPLAMLTVRWIPYTVPQSEPQCPVHHKELQLFDRYTKELLCALCVSKNGSSASELIVIPDILTGDSRRSIAETLSRQLQQGQQNAAQWVSQHKRIVSIAKHKKDAVNRQFDMLLAAVKSKRDEFLEQCDATFGFALGSVAKEILMADEKLHLLKAGIDHLQTESSRPLYSMQIATVANALYASDEFPKPFSLESLKIPALTNALTPNLEAAMSDIQQLSPLMPRTSIHRPHSPFRPTSRDAGLEEYLKLDKNHHHQQQQHELYNPYENTDQRRKKMGMISSAQQPSPRNTRESSDQRRGILRSGGNSRSSDRLRESSRRHSMPLVPARANVDYIVDEGGTLSGRRERHQWRAIPGCRGTCILDVLINEMMNEVDDVRSGRSKPKYIQWTLRVNDPGDWVGLGVGVGSDPEYWSESRTPDLNHLWVVTGNNTRQTFILRVTVNPSVSHAKLSIHDQKGRQLDDGRIPQWKAARACYPQVTFGGRIGEVNLIEDPHVVSK